MDTLKFCVIKQFNYVNICNKKKNYLHSGEYTLNKKISVKTPMLQLDLFDYSDAYIAVKGRISVTVTGTDTVKR